MLYLPKEKKDDERVQLLNGDRNLGDTIKGRVLVSSDDEHYEQFGNSFDKELEVDLEDYAMNVKYIKVTSEHFDSWSALREIKLNETTTNGVVKSIKDGSVYGNNKSSYALDGDENTFACLSSTIAENFNLSNTGLGNSILSKLK